MMLFNDRTFQLNAILFGLGLIPPYNDEELFAHNIGRRNYSTIVPEDCRRTWEESLSNLSSNLLSELSIFFAGFLVCFFSRHCLWHVHIYALSLDSFVCTLTLFKCYYKLFLCICL